MKFKWTSSNKFIIKFLLSLFILGIIIGFIVFYKESALVKASITGELASLETILKTINQNNFIYHLLLLSVLSILSLIVFGLPVILFYLFYEGISFGFLLAGLFHYKKLSGLMFGLVFGFVNKLLVYLSLMYLLIISLNYSKRMLISLKNKDRDMPIHISNQLVKIAFIFIVLMIADVFIYFLGNKILAYFLFLL